MLGFQGMAPKLSVKHVCAPIFSGTLYTLAKAHTKTQPAVGFTINTSYAICALAFPIKFDKTWNPGSENTSKRNYFSKSGLGRRNSHSNSNHLELAQHVKQIFIEGKQPGTRKEEPPAKFKACVIRAEIKKKLRP